MLFQSFVTLVVNLLKNMFLSQKRIEDSYSLHFTHLNITK